MSQSAGAQYHTDEKLIGNSGPPQVGVSEHTAAQLLVRSLTEQKVKHIFGIPGGKIMPVFNVLDDEGPELIVCRHEQNAAFIAGAIGRLTGRPGVCLVTSGPFREPALSPAISCRCSSAGSTCSVTNLATSYWRKRMSCSR